MMRFIGARALALLLVLACGGGSVAAQTSAAPQSSLNLPSFAPLAKRVLPAVVNVSAVLRPGAPADEDSDDNSLSPFDELLRRFFEQQGIPQPQQRERNMAIGSGFIIDPTGYIVTNGHVVANAERVTVTFNDNSRHPAKIVGQDSLTDLAVLKIDMPQPLPYITWGDSDAVEVGDWVLAVGDPFGLGSTLGFGIISARGRDLHSGPYDDFLQIDASLNRGNSGGPTVNLNGRVVGVNTAIYSPNGGSVGIGFAIPASIAKPVVDQLRAHGRVTRGWLGVQIQAVTPELARSLKLASPNGVLIAGLTDVGPAAKAGLRQGDVILTFDGHAISQMRDLPLTVAQTPVGKTVAVEVWRNAAKTTLSVHVEAMPGKVQVSQGARPNAGAPNSSPPRRTTALGLQLAPLTDNLRQRLHLKSGVKGVVVLDVAPSSPFADQDIKEGDVVESIDRQAVSSPAELASRLNQARQAKQETVLLLINRGGQNVFVTLSFGDSAASPDTG